MKLFYFSKGYFNKGLKVFFENSIVMYLEEKFQFIINRANRLQGKLEDLPFVEDVKFSGVGWKSGYLLELIIPEFKGMVHGKYGVEDYFKCQDWGHRSPDVDCSCGFYSFKDKDRAINERKRDKSLFLLKTSNYGLIIDHQWGMRSEMQVLEEIFINNRCARTFCHEETVGIGKERDDNYVGGSLFPAFYRPLCTKHLEKVEFSCKMNDIGRFFNLPISFFELSNSSKSQS